MLKDVRIHLDTDEKRQNAREREVAALIMQNVRRNEATFKAYVPSLVKVVKQAQSQHISVFINRFGNINIVNYNNGRTFYGLHPAKEILAQYALKKKSCTYCSLTGSSETPDYAHRTALLKELPIFKGFMSQPPLPQNIDVLVVLGVGLGEHIKYLVENHNIGHLIIYEPEIQYFQCSVLGIDWRPIFETAKEKTTKIYFQLENNGSTLVDDVNELKQSNPFEGFYLYRHYNHELFNCIEHALVISDWHHLRKNGLASYLPQCKDTSLPFWSPVVEPDKYLSVSSENLRFKANIAAFHKYFPSIASEFESYQPAYWLPVIDENNKINVLSRFSLSAWFSDTPEEDALQNLANFATHPNKDGLVLGYEGEKLKNFLHFRFVQKAQKILKSTSEETGILPETIKSLILFGVGPQLNGLNREYEVEKLFICEPDKDLFYASLFYIHWAELLRKVDANNGRLYINVGDDGTNLFKDLINQFYSVGPYILANTYFYQTYHNEMLVRTISQLREQLQVVIAMGENFDHARHGIAHTRETIIRKYPILESEPARKLSQSDKDVPVFIVGNGPSLDGAIAAIKEWRNHAIVISCGTALMPLYKNGIVPDFHAEIEQNRSTFDWCTRIGDFDYLKKINLISCNGIHPDTCKIFKNTYIAFKEGESSTVSSLNILGRENYEELQFAFPTVSNFVMNITTLIGFEQIYLFGVDLGFIDQKKHHSSLSGYYDNNGKEKYSYQLENNTHLVVPGNFEKFVFTKYEFKVSRVIIERSLAQVKVDCFNTSNGAKIEGSVPLSVDNILIMSSIEQRDITLDKLLDTVFRPVRDEVEYHRVFDEKYNPDVLAEEIAEFESLVAIPFTDSSDVEKLSEKQKELLFDSYLAGNSLLFYYLYGTVNYANSMFSKLNYASLDNESKLAKLNELRIIWLNTLGTISNELHDMPYLYDHVSSFSYEREEVFLRERTSGLRVHSHLSEYDTHKLDVLAHKRAIKNKHVIATEWFNDASVSVRWYHDRVFEDIKAEGKPVHTILLVPVTLSLRELLPLSGNVNITFLYVHPELVLPEEQEMYLSGRAVLSHEYMTMTSLLKACVLYENSLAILPKTFFVSASGDMSEPVAQYAKQLYKNFSDVAQIIDFPNYWVVPRNKLLTKDNVIDILGNRGALRTSVPDEYALFVGSVNTEKAKIQLSNYNKAWWERVKR